MTTAHALLGLFLHHTIVLVQLPHSLEDCRTAMSPSSAFEADQRFFPTATCHELVTLKGGDDFRIAANAAREQLLRTLKRRSSTDLRLNARTAEEAKERFLGFLKNRINTTLPKWWQNALIKSEYSNPLLIPPPVDPELVYVYDAELEYWRSIPGSISRKGSVLICCQDDAQCQIPIHLLTVKQPSYGIAALSVTFEGTRCYFATISYSGEPFRVFCLDQCSGKILWECESWGTGAMIPPTGHPVRPTVIEMIAKNDELFIFGCARDGCFVEVFDSATGKISARFSTSY